MSAHEPYFDRGRTEERTFAAVLSSSVGDCCGRRGGRTEGGGFLGERVLRQVELEREWRDGRTSMKSAKPWEEELEGAGEGEREGAIASGVSLSVWILAE